MSIQLSTRVMHIKDETTGSYDTVDILKGSGIDDVQINGISVVEDGVAEIPVASSTAFGVVKSGNGLNINTSGQMYIYRATSNNVKEGSHAYNPITPYTQHESTFYGLAKAANDSTQAASTNTVGNYT